MMIQALTRAFSRKPAFAALALAPALLVTAPTPAMAQGDLSEARLRKIEAEIRALQRNVFPGSDDRFFEPQIQADQTTTTRTTGPSTTAVTDILARLDAIEVQLQRLTGISEENANAIALLSTRVADVETQNASLLAADTSVTGPTDEAPSDEPRAMGANLAAMGAGEDASAASAQTSASSALPSPVPTSVNAPGANAPGATEPTNAGSLEGPSPERLAAVQAITKPQTEDPADDEYSYGFRLWNAGFYPEARQQLASFLNAYPDHWRATYGRNLLGRAYLDDGETEEAARWFLRNYQTDRTAARAPDSLLFLAEAMIARDDTRRACIALAEFGDTYPDEATGRLLERYQANRTKVTCDS